MEAITWRGIERVVIIVGAIVIGYLGYRLYRFGLTEGKSKLNFKSDLFNLAL